MARVASSARVEARPKRGVLHDASLTRVGPYDRAAQVESPKFAGLNVVKQHKLVQECLKVEISEMHGFQLKTKLPQ